MACNPSPRFKPSNSWNSDMWNLLRNDEGVSGIEFGLIAPVLAIALLGIFAGWSYSTQNSAMRDSVETAAKYFILGGKSDETAESIAESAWSNRPDDGVVDVEKACRCNGGSASCSAVCADSSVPQIYFTITASSTWTNPFLNSLFSREISLQETEVVRVR